MSTTFQHFFYKGWTDPSPPDFIKNLDKKNKDVFQGLTWPFYFFDVNPCPAPRMTRSDKWKVNPNHSNPEKRQREPVRKYFSFRDAIRLQANLMNFVMQPELDALFLVPMPDSWTKKKKEEMNYKPCQSKPDLDNLTKALKDALCKEDNFVYKESTEKLWSYYGAVIIYQ